MQKSMQDNQAFRRLLAQMEPIAELVPAWKREWLERMGLELSETVRDEIAKSGLRDPAGRVRSWQNSHLGTRLGYVAVRPDSVEVSAGGGGQRVNAGALTNYLTSGHKVRSPSGRAKRYVPRGNMVRVPGYGFYSRASAGVNERALQTAKEKFLTLLKEQVEFGGFDS